MINALNKSTQAATPEKRAHLGGSPLLARLAKVVTASTLAILASSCTDDPGKFTRGNLADAGISSPSDGGSVDTGSASDGGSAADTGSADSGSAQTDTTSSTVDTSSTTQETTSADTSSGTADTSIPSTPGIDAGTPKVTKPAPADEWMSEYKKGMELPIQQVFVSNMPYTGVEGVGYKPGVTDWKNHLSATVNGADAYQIPMAMYPQDPTVAGIGNFRVVVTNHPAGAKVGTWVSTLTGKYAQDNVTPLYDQAPILPVLCADGVYMPEDAELLAVAMQMAGSMEYNHNLEEMHDTYFAHLQKCIGIVFGAAGKKYAPVCNVQVVTPGKPDIIDGQDCPAGCLYASVTVLPEASWTELVQQK